MQHLSCLNCHTELNGKYCSHCGQSANSHRITMRHFFKHDLLHGLWHLEKGILFTLKQSLLRPGAMAMDYIRGSRVKYYNFFYLLLMLIGVNVLVSQFFNNLYHIRFTPATVNEKQVNAKDLIESNYKIILFALIPFFALAGSIMFRRAKLNLAEHMIVGANLLLSASLWYFFYNLCYYFSYNLIDDGWRIAVIGFLILLALLPVQVYVAVTKKIYTRAGFAWRILGWYLLLCIMIVAAITIPLFISGKKEIVL